MTVTINKELIIKCTLEEWVILQPQLEKYYLVNNNAYLTKLNLGLSVKDELTTFALAEIKIKNEQVTVNMPIGLWDYIKHLLPLEYQNINNVPEKHIQKSLDRLSKYNILYSDPEYYYQVEAIKGMVRYRNGILKAKPGSGKTVMGGVLGLVKGDSVLFINDRIELCKQALKTFVNKLNVDPNMCGLLQGDNEEIKPYTFTTIQKLHKVLNKGFNDPTKELVHFDTIVIDECHHAVGSYNSYQTYFQALMELDYTNLYGLTATNERVDGNEYLVYSLIGAVRWEVSEGVKTLTATVQNKHFHLPTSKETYYSLMNVYTGKLMPSKVDKHLLFNEEYKDFCKPFILKALNTYNKILIVSPLVEGAKGWSEWLTSINKKHFLVYGAIKKREQLYTSKILVATLDLVKEGFDVPDLECVIVISRDIHKQIKTQVVGRCERYMEHKKQPYALFLTPHLKKEWKRETPWKEVVLNDL